MQELNSPRGRPRWRPRRPRHDTGRTDLRWGIGGVAGVLVLAAAFGIVRFVDFGSQTYRAELADAGALRTGDEVRLAGITVGAVSSIALRDNHVELAFEVDQEVFVGDRTTLDVRMLTIVGGRYLAIHPAGTTPLGSTPIPRDRVILPYSLPRVFQDAVEPVRELDGDALRQSFGALADALGNGNQPVDGLLTIAEHLTALLHRQNADISRTLSLSDEYLTALSGNRDVLGRLITSLRLLETLIEDNIWAVGSLDQTAEVVRGVAGLGREWESTIEPALAPLLAAVAPGGALADSLGPLLDAVRALVEQLGTLVGPDGELAVDQSGLSICVPVTGRTC